MSISETLVSVNYYFSRKYNYEYSFYFYTKKTSSILPLDKAKRRIKLLKEARIKKLNFTSSKPFLYPIFMCELLCYKKGELGIESISIISNNLKITEKFLRENAIFINILTISCDSFDPEINIKIRRGKSRENVE
jgi:radical S-adenosyl methionine domain-containing protein 2